MMRQAGRELLALALLEARNRSLRLFAAFEAGGRLDLPGSIAETPRRWLGRLGWFQEAWISRQVERHLGPAADPSRARLASIEPNADLWFGPAGSVLLRGSDSGLPAPDVIRQYLLDTLDITLDLLLHSPETDASLYFYRLALFHEDAQAEQLLGLAQRLGLAMPDQPAPQPQSQRRRVLEFDARSWDLGQPPEPESRHDTLAVLTRQGYRSDLETGHRRVRLPAHQIDTEPVTWGQYLDFMRDGGYDDPRWWSEAGWQWARSRCARSPRQTRWNGDTLLQRHYSHEREVDPSQPVQLVNAYEAEAWCRWAGRRLPSEAEWEHAARSGSGGQFRWGQVWEWTSDALHFYPGYRPGPLHGQLAGTLGLHRVLRGGSHATAARLKHPCFRHHLAPGDESGFCGFRSCTP
jgi:ergothioneine biosynthesis protein EgtB